MERMNIHNSEPANAASANKLPVVTCRHANIALCLGISCWASLCLWITFWSLSGIMVRASVEGPFVLIVALIFALVTAGSAIVAMVAGFKAGRLIRSNPALAGMGRARAGGLLGALYLLLLLAATLIPGFVPARTIASKNACINNLRQLDGAKEQWALELKKTATDTPAWADLIGSDKYIKNMPICDKQGTYTIHPMMHNPTCSVPSHTLP